MVDPQIVAFAGVSLLLTLTPGAETAVTIKNGVQHGRGAGFTSILGTCLGLLVHGSLSALGLSVILARSATAFSVVKWLGAGYLVVLGLLAIRSAIRGDGLGPLEPPAGAAQPPGLRRPALRTFFQGLLTNLLNPKVALFYLAFLPQFVNPGDAVLAKSLLLASIHVAWGLLWLSTLVVAIGRMRGLFARPGVKRGMEGVTGTVLVAFGARLAWAR